MKKIGVILLGVGFGILFYIIFSFFFKTQGLISPVEEPSTNTVIRQNSK
jgi:hypothetical protein